MERVEYNPNFSALLHRYIAFTLAEVLIVLGIIGIIAEITIPTVVQNASDSATISQVKKEYSQIQAAIKAAEPEEGKIWEWYTGGNVLDGMNKAYQILSKYLKVTKNCGITDTGCFPASNYQNLSKGYTGYSNYANGGMVLADGTLISLGATLSSNYINKLYLYVDINGTKGPNRWGYDLFSFYVNSYPYDNKFNQILLPANTNTSITLTNSNTLCDLNASDVTGTGFGCAVWIIYKSTVDYKYGKALTLP